MNGSGKQSFYEIQLSNGSLIVAFVIAVGIGVAVFMLGVMVGRGQSPQPLPEGGWVESLAPGESGAAAEEEPVDAAFLDTMAGSEEETAASEPAPERPAEERREAPAATTPADTSPSGLPQADNIASGHVVQVKATSVRDEAEALQAVLAAAGFPAFVINAEVNGATMYRVRVGRYRNRADAERVAAALGERDDIGQTWVTEG